MRKLTISILILCSVGMIIYVFWFLLLKTSDVNEEVSSSSFLILLALMGAIFSGVITFSSRNTPAIRRTWAFIGLASLSNCIAEILYFHYSYVIGIDPFPSLADLFYLLFYPLLLLGILNLPNLPIRKEDRMTVSLDVIIIMVVGGILIWYTILGPLINEPQSGFSGLISMAYPLGDFLVLAGLVSLLQRDLDRVGWVQLAFLVICVAATGLADILYAIVQNEGANISEAFMNAMWMLSSWALLMAAGWQILAPAVKSSTGEITFLKVARQYSIYLIPLFGFIFTFTTLTSSFQLDQRLTGTLVMTVLLLLLVYLRQGLLLRDNRQLYQKMEHLAVTDALTNLYNRHSFNEAIYRETNRTKRHGRDLGLLLLDIDHFKRFNDTFGHLKGDQLLKDFAGALKDSIRKTDFLARFGGDEFVLILPETNLNDARQVAQKIESVIKERFPEEGLGISIGMAAYKPGMSEQTLLNEADQDLYQQKRRKANEGFL